MGISVGKHSLQGRRACWEDVVKAEIRGYVGLDCVYSGDNQAGQARFLNILLIIRDRDRSQDADDRHDDHQFHEGKTFAFLSF